MRTYADHNATSFLRPSAKQAMLAAMEEFGNASSIHREGRLAHHQLEEARATIARALGTIAPTVIFTSGGTEANHLALRGVEAERILVSAIEHPSALAAAQASGKPVSQIPVTAEGIVDLAALAGLLARGPALVSVMLANNETGIIQPIREIVALAKANGCLVHCDAVQGFGKLAVNMGLLGVDLLSIAPHKVGGPKGVGALVVRDGLTLTALLSGGGQELRRRAGTENLVAIAGFAAVTQENIIDTSGLRDSLERVLEGVTVVGASSPRLSNTLSCFCPGFSAESLVINFDLEGVALSSGSACSSGKVSASHVLAAMGVPVEVARSAIRISLGWNSTEQDIHHIAQVWQAIRARRTGAQAA